jgi:organic radical activating enzyme
MIHTEFRPDLIVEATNACDRVCPGCYAPNVLVEAAPSSPAPGVVHLAPELLDRAWPQDKRVGTVSVRGGEPTLNPQIGALVRRISERAAAVYLETNGGWIAAGSPLLAVLSENGCIVKVSLDKMHGTSPDEARAKLAVLSAAGVKVAIAITENTREEFERTRARLLQGFDGEVFWQKKAATSDELVRPALGVISAKGRLNDGVTSLLGEIPLARKS